jgi:hypothetical protein
MFRNGECYTSDQLADVDCGALVQLVQSGFLSHFNGYYIKNPE